MHSGHFETLLTRARQRLVLIAGGTAVMLAILAALVLAAPSARAGGGHPAAVHDQVAVDSVVEAPSALPTGAPDLPPTPYRLPLLGTGNGVAGPAPVARAGSFISVPAVGLQVGVIDYSDCNGSTPMTRTAAVRFGCTPSAVTTLVGHNPGVFTPLTRTHGGEQVHYQHDGVDDVYAISEIHRVSPQQAAAYSQDGSYTHAVLATCAEPDSSAYWIFIALPQGPVHSASAPRQAGAEPSSRPGATPAPAHPQPSPTPSPTPSGTTLPGGIIIPPPPG